MLAKHHARVLRYETAHGASAAWDDLVFLNRYQARPNIAREIIAVDPQLQPGHLADTSGARWDLLPLPYRSWLPAL